MRRCHDCRRPPSSFHRACGSLVARAVSFVEIDARTPEERRLRHPSIHLRSPRARAPPPALSVRSFCEIAWICARHHHHLPARPNNWQWLYPPKGRPRDAAFHGRNMCHSDWQLQCTCALWLVRGGVINSHQYDQDSTVKPPTRGRGIVSLEDLVSLLLLLRCYILISFGPQFSLGNELCSTKISGISIPLFPFPIVTWLLRWSSLVLFTVAILRDVARRHCRPIRREANSNNKRDDRQATTRFAPSSSLIRSWAFVGHDCYAWGASTHARGSAHLSLSSCPVSL